MTIRPGEFSSEQRGRPGADDFHTWPRWIFRLSAICLALAGFGCGLSCAAAEPPPEEQVGSASSDPRAVAIAGSTEGSGAHAAAHAAAHGTGPANRLADAASPYLRLHGHDPVDWYPWGPEALEKARLEQKPIFLSVGYSTCYWCHVMQRESFSDPEVAALLKKGFVAIKVDREERPDLDEIYMLATQILQRGAGGWPNSVFLTPELQPFFAGTYFPKEDRYGRPGFVSVLKGLDSAWSENRGDLRQRAEAVAAAIGRAMEGASQILPVAPPGPEVAVAALRDLRPSFDGEHGGVGREPKFAPKFPSPSNLFLLLELEESGSGEDASIARSFVELTLDRMARGGIYDQVGGGFHRYATDRLWRVPHFEKMLYDNGSLLEVYSIWQSRVDGWQRLQAERVLRQTAGFLAREMTAPGGAFYAAIDAETDAKEGAFYVWTPQELAAALGEKDRVWAAPALGFAEAPSFVDPHAAEGEAPTHIPYQPALLAELAAQSGSGLDEFLTRLDRVRGMLLKSRDRRPRPLTDSKILTDWNGLAIAGLAEAGRVLGDPEIVAQAVEAADFLLVAVRPKGRPLQHAWQGSEVSNEATKGTDLAAGSRIDAYLTDYAYFVHGLLALHRATEEARWLDAAIRLADEMSSRLEDTHGGGFYVAADRADLLFRSKDANDGARPSPNGMAILNLLKLHRRTGEPRFLQRADLALRSFSAAVVRSPAGHPTLALAARRRAEGGISVNQPSSSTVASAAMAAPTTSTASGTPAGGAVGALEALAREKVEAEARFDGPAESGRRPIVVSLQIADNWHVNANPASDEWLIPTELVAVDRAISKQVFPRARDLDSSFSEGKIRVYSGKVAISALLAEGPGTAKIRLRYQVCDAERCLPAVEEEVVVEQPGSGVPGGGQRWP